MKDTNNTWKENHDAALSTFDTAFNESFVQPVTLNERELLIECRVHLESYRNYADAMSRIGRGHAPIIGRGWSTDYLIAAIKNNLNQ